MKVLIALHNPELELPYTILAKAYGHTSMIPTGSGHNAEKVISALEERPDSVIMDVNYGFPGQYTHEPILRVASAMESKGYNLKSALLGITGLSDLAESVEKEGIPAAEKTDTSRLIKFLSPKSQESVINQNNSPGNL